MTKQSFLRNLLGSNFDQKGASVLTLERPVAPGTGQALSNFDDWLRAATRCWTSDLHSEDWRGLALGYSRKQAVKELHLFFGVIKARPLLADQAKALLFSLSANLLPAAKVLQKLNAEDEEQQRVKEALIKKKTLGDEAFWRENFKAIVWEDEFNQVSFPLENGNRITREPFSGNKRLATVFGQATVISLIDKADKEPEDTGFYVFILVDGEVFARKHGDAQLEKILLNS
jgi:hypothetical protein